MTTLMPQSPGHWTEAVLLAFPEAILTNDYPEGGVLHVTLPLEDDFEIEFRRDEFTLPDAPESFSANLQEYDDDSHLVREELLFDSSSIDILTDVTRDWVEGYYDDMAELAAVDTVPKEWTA